MRRALTRTALALALAGAAPSLAAAVPLQPDALMGRSVMGRDGEKIGEVTAVVRDREGRVRQVVVNALDLLTVAGKDIAIDITDLRLRSDSAHLHAPGIGRADVGALPSRTPETATP